MHKGGNTFVVCTKKPMGPSGQITLYSMCRVAWRHLCSANTVFTEGPDAKLPLVVSSSVA